MTNNERKWLFFRAVWLCYLVYVFPVVVVLICSSSVVLWCMGWYSVVPLVAQGLMVGSLWSTVVSSINILFSRS